MQGKGNKELFDTLLSDSQSLVFKSLALKSPGQLLKIQIFLEPSRDSLNQNL